MCFQRLSYSAPVLPKDVTASECSAEDVAIFTQTPWTDMLRDLDLNGNNRGEEVMYQTYTAKFKDGAINSSCQKGIVVPKVQL